MGDVGTYDLRDIYWQPRPAAHHSLFGRADRLMPRRNSEGQAFDSTRSERQLMERLEYDLHSADEILASIRSNRPHVERPLPAVPLFDANPPSSLLAAFKDALERMGGVFLDPPEGGDVFAPGEQDRGGQGHLLDRVGDRRQPRYLPHRRRSCLHSAQRTHSPRTRGTFQHDQRVSR
jgi:hypothetical protein